MPDDYLNQPPRAAGQRRSNGRYLVLALLGAVVLGGAGGLWGASRLGWIDFTTRQSVAETLAAPLSAPTPTPSAAGLESAQTALGVRMAELEQRMTRLNFEAEAASGNAARAEGLLIASAARRSVERGVPDSKSRSAAAGVCRPSSPAWSGMDAAARSGWQELSISRCVWSRALQSQPW